MPQVILSELQSILCCWRWHSTRHQIRVLLTMHSWCLSTQCMNSCLLSHCWCLSMSLFGWDSLSWTSLL